MHFWAYVVLIGGFVIIGLLAYYADLIIQFFGRPGGGN